MMSADVRAMLPRPRSGWFGCAFLICSISLTAKSLDERSRHFDAEHFANTMLMESMPVYVVLFPAAFALICRPLGAAFGGRLGRTANRLGTRSATLAIKGLDALMGVVLGVAGVQFLHDVVVESFDGAMWAAIAYVVAYLTVMRVTVAGAWHVTWKVSTDAERCLMAWIAIVCSFLSVHGVLAEFSPR